MEKVHHRARLSGRKFVPMSGMETAPSNFSNVIGGLLEDSKGKGKATGGPQEVGRAILARAILAQISVPRGRRPRNPPMGQNYPAQKATSMRRPRGIAHTSMFTHACVDWHGSFFNK